MQHVAHDDMRRAAVAGIHEEQLTHQIVVVQSCHHDFALFQVLHAQDLVKCAQHRHMQAALLARNRRREHSV